MDRSDLKRWAAELCGWENVSEMAGQRDRFQRPDSRVTVNVWFECAGDAALAFDLLAKFVEATPEPQYGSAVCPSVDWSHWRDKTQVVLDAIRQGPLAVIRTIKETGVLNA